MQSLKVSSRTCSWKWTQPGPSWKGALCWRGNETSWRFENFWSFRAWWAASYSHKGNCNWTRFCFPISSSNSFTRVKSTKNDLYIANMHVCSFFKKSYTAHTWNYRHIFDAFIFDFKKAFLIYLPMDFMNARCLDMALTLKWIDSFLRRKESFCKWSNFKSEWAQVKFCRVFYRALSLASSCFPYILIISRQRLIQR